MQTEERAAGERSREHVIEVVLVDGGRLEARVGADEERARTELAGLHARLHEDAFLRVGGDTIVRAGEVRWLQLRPRDGGDGDGLMSTVMNTIRGGDGMGNYETHHSHQGGGGGQMPWLGYGRRPYSETKPFFLTSEFVAFAGMLAALLIALAVSDTLNGFRGWLLPTIVTAAYIISRGIAKSGERDPNPQRMQQGMGGGYADAPLGREQQTVIR